MSENTNEDHEMLLDPSLIGDLDVEYPLEKTKHRGVLDRIMDQVYRLNNGVSDVLENIDIETEKCESENNTIRRKFQNLFLPKKKINELILLTQDFEDGYYLHKDIVGSKEKKTKHLHMFIMKKEGGNLIFSFVDPEHHVGVSNKLRPSICNLMSFSVSSNPIVEPNLSILRFKTNKFIKHDKEVAQFQRKIRYGALVRSAFDLNENNGLASFMEEDDDSVTFRLNIRGNNTVLGSRYVKGMSMEHLSQNIPLHIRAKANSQRHIMNTIINVLRADNFKELPDSKKELWGIED